MNKYKERKPLDETFSDYSLRARIETSVAGYGGNLDFVDEYMGDILIQRHEEKSARAGHFDVLVVRLDDALNSGASSFDVFDAHGGDLSSYWAPLVDRNRCEFRRSIRRQFAIAHENLMILNRVEVLPAHRGRFLGLAVANKLIELLGRGCGLVALCPAPLQFSHTSGPGRGWRPNMRLGAFEKRQVQATAQLRDYWSKLGFKRVGRSSIYALSLPLRRPKIDQTCGLELD